MKIGIIIHSKTGVTLGFGNLIAGKLRESGHVVEVIDLKTEGAVHPGARKFSVTNIPDCGRFDAVLVGGPVWAFAASPVILSCIRGMVNISGKKALPFATMGFPFACMGGTRALGQMSRALAEAGATVLQGKAIPQMFRNASRLMEAAASDVPKLLAGPGN